jgi:hypothetical protein
MERKLKGRFNTEKKGKKYKERKEEDIKIR